MWHSCVDRPAGAGLASPPHTHAALPPSLLVLETASQPVVSRETTGPPPVNSVVTEQQKVLGPRGAGGDHETGSSWSFCFTPIFVYVGRGSIFTTDVQ